MTWGIPVPVANGMGAKAVMLQLKAFEVIMVLSIITLNARAEYGIYYNNIEII